jgi:hypothetical protein
MLIVFHCFFDKSKLRLPCIWQVRYQIIQIAYYFHRHLVYVMSIFRLGYLNFSLVAHSHSNESIFTPNILTTNLL